MCVASSVSPSPGGFFGHGGAGKERKADFKNTGPQTLNWDRGSLRLCHIKLYLWTLQTYHNYLMENGL